ncbi:hypothetical protein S100892_02081 [Pediococcus pentosaceus]|uniref:Uncharacterized protein n=1 Tax=Pediococcus pentosaceus TaxID=1255 RepID=A0A1Y0VR24_PEDPE|nr:hypothetical protein S100892_02081 [Pediococcus pentosaceus]
MENNERTIKLGLEHLLEDGREKIVYGALKNYALTPAQSNLTIFYRRLV